MVKARILRKVEWTATDEDHKPDVSFMPMMVRRRLSMVERAALHVAWTVFNPKEGDDVLDSLPEMGTVPVVFASRGGEIGTTLKLMRQLHSEGEIHGVPFIASGRAGVAGGGDGKIALKKLACSLCHLAGALVADLGVRSYRFGADPELVYFYVVCVGYHTSDEGGGSARHVGEHFADKPARAGFCG